MDDCNELKKSVAEVEAGVTKTLATDLLASCIENAVRISSRKEDGCDARKWPRGAERTWKLSERLLLCRPWTGTVDVDGGQGQGWGIIQRWCLANICWDETYGPKRVNNSWNFKQVQFVEN